MCILDNINADIDVIVTFRFKEKTFDSSQERKPLYMSLAEVQYLNCIK